MQIEWKRPRYEIDPEKLNRIVLEDHDPAALELVLRDMERQLLGRIQREMRDEYLKCRAPRYPSPAPRRGNYFLPMHLWP